MDSVSEFRRVLCSSFFGEQRIVSMMSCFCVVMVREPTDKKLESVGDIVLVLRGLWLLEGEYIGDWVEGTAIRHRWYRSSSSSSSSTSAKARAPMALRSLQDLLVRTPSSSSKVSLSSLSESLRCVAGAEKESSAGGGRDNPGTGGGSDSFRRSLGLIRL